MSQQEIFQSSIVWVILSAAVCFFSKNCSHAFFQRYYNYFNRKLTAIQSINGTVYFSEVNHIFVFCFVFCSPGLILESKGMSAIFKKRAKKGKIFETFGKNVQNSKIFWKRAASCVRLWHAWNSENMPCSHSLLLPFSRGNVSTLQARAASSEYVIIWNSYYFE